MQCTLITLLTRPSFVSPILCLRCAALLLLASILPSSIPPRPSQNISPSPQPAPLSLSYLWRHPLSSRWTAAPQWVVQQHPLVSRLKNMCLNLPGFLVICPGIDAVPPDLRPFSSSTPAGKTPCWLCGSLPDNTPPTPLSSLSRPDTLWQHWRADI